MKQLVSLFAGLAIIRLAFAGTVETELTGTTSSPVSGWEYNVGSEYADGSLKLDKTGSFVVSEMYSGAVTSLTVRIKGNSISGGNTVLELYGSSDGTTFSETPLAQVIPTTSIENHETVLDAEQGLIRFKWVMVKDKGNIGLYAVTAKTDDTPVILPPQPPTGLSVTDRTEEGFTLNWSGSSQATDYLVSVFCLTGTPATVTRMGFDGYPATEPSGWTITLNSKDPIYDSSTYSGISPPAVKLTETGHAIETPNFEPPIASFSFWSKATGKDSALRIEAHNGTEWVTVDTYPVGTGATTKEYAFETEETYSRFKITLEKPLTANVALDDLTFTSFSSLAPSNVMDRAQTGTETSIRIENLPKGTYYCQVIAQNGAGESQPSEALMVTVGDTDDPQPEEQPVAAVPITESAGTYVQDFNALETASVNVWTNGIMPLTGWYAFADSEPCVSYRGGGSGGGLWALADPSGDRALGSQGANGQTYRYGVSFTNKTDQTLTEFDIVFSASERYIGKSDVANLLAFTYRVAETAAPLNEGTWSRIPDLCFVTPAYGEGLSGATNLTSVLTGTLRTSVPPRAVLSLRWVDADDPGTDHRFAIDDFSVTWRAGPPPAETVEIPLAGAEETFDAVLVEPFAALPSAWGVGAGDLSPDNLSHVLDAVFSGSAKGGFFAFCANPSVDTTLGAWPTPESPALHLIGAFQSRLPIKITRWNVSFLMRKMGSGTTPTVVSLWSSRDGIAWTPCGQEENFEADAVFSRPAATDLPAADRTVTRTARFDQAIPPDGRFFLAWRFAPVGTLTESNAQVVGVDQVTVTPEIPQGTVLIVE